MFFASMDRYQGETMKKQSLTILLVVIVLTGATSFAHATADPSWNPNVVSKMTIGGKSDPNLKMTPGGVPTDYVWGVCEKCDREMEIKLAARSAAPTKTVSADEVQIRSNGDR